MKPNKKLRKTLGNKDAPCLVALRDLIDALPKPLVASWYIAMARARFLPLYEAAYPGDSRPAQALLAAQAWLEGRVKLPHVRDIILNQAHAAAREAVDKPAAQAAARAVAQAASAIHVKQHALGLAFYGAAALAYAQLGLDASADAYQLVFEQLCTELTASLIKASADQNQQS